MTKEEALMTIQAIPESFWEKLSDAENEAVEMAVKALKGQMWVPCSERFPTEKEAWDYNAEEDLYEPNEFIVQVKGAELPTVAMFDGETFTHGYAEDGYGFMDEIIAWMPLPEPYN